MIDREAPPAFAARVGVSPAFSNAKARSRGALSFSFVPAIRILSILRHFRYVRLFSAKSVIGDLAYPPPVTQ